MVGAAVGFKSLGDRGSKANTPPRPSASQQPAAPAIPPPPISGATKESETWRFADGTLREWNGKE
jgi:hypothetical protein